MTTWIYTSLSNSTRKNELDIDDDDDVDDDCIDNNDDYEIAMPFSKRIKLEETTSEKPIQYTADIIVEIKNREGKTVPIRALLDTGTTSTIILR